jgi:hypothetical protein
MSINNKLLLEAATFVVRMAVQLSFEANWNIGFGRGHVGCLVDRSPAVRAKAIIRIYFVPAVPTISIRHSCDPSSCLPRT